MPSLDSLMRELEKNNVVEAARMLKDWHPITLSNLLLAIQAARTLHSPTNRWPEYERAVLALAWHEGLTESGSPHEFPEAALSIVEMAVDFNLE